MIAQISTAYVRIASCSRMLAYRAYVVHANPEKVRTNGSKMAFQQSVQKWVEGRVARHKFLRGGKRFPSQEERR